MLRMTAGAAEEVRVTAGTGQVNTRSTELSYLVDERTIERIPINGRNFTDLMALQPGVTPFPHRETGSVVAHGLAMSVNGVEPRGTVYLLDEVFNVFNRANFGTPSLIAFAGTSDNEAPLASFGQIRSTSTSSRQVQLGVRWSY